MRQEDVPRLRVQAVRPSIPLRNRPAIKCNESRDRKERLNSTAGQSLPVYLPPGTQVLQSRLLVLPQFYLTVVGLGFDGTGSGQRLIPKEDAIQGQCSGE